MIASLRASGWNVNKIAAYVHRDLSFVLKICQQLPAPDKSNKEIGVIEIPPEVLADRDRRADLYHTELTAILCGDPLPCQSALGRRA